MAQTAYILSEKTVRDLQELARLVQQLGGAEALRQKVDVAQDQGFRTYLGRVTVATESAVVDANDNPVQWSYTIEEVAKVKTGLTNATNTGVWQSKGADYTYSGAYRLIEDGNTGTGRQVYGVDHDGDLVTSTMAMQPLVVGTIVTFIFVPVATAAGVLTVEPWITGTWATIDGTCS